jgi:isopentenyl diphosphate isomerase/L-lactate dehydrogenase-like FMN-dependent dehydrogenase
VSELDDVTRLDDFEPLARARMGAAELDYVAGGAGDEVTLADNVAAFRRWRLRPRVLIDVSEVDTSTMLLDAPVALPVAMAPVAFQHFAHADAEPASARAAARAGALFCLSTVSSRSLEEVAAAADAAGGAGAARWFQLYVHRNRERAAELVARAAAAGYRAIVVTADLPLAGNRERDRRNALAYPQSFGNFEWAAGAGDDPIAATIGAFTDATLTWHDLAWLRSLTALPIIVKGILTAEDGALAMEHGAAGVVVSNHGGRQLDRTPATIDVLAEVVDAVAGRGEVYLDGGVRRGVDVLTALALGARGVLIGRPLVYALAAGGEAGVARAFEILAAELRTDMALLGVTRLDQLTRAHVAQVAG